MSHIQVMWGNEDHTIIIWAFEKGWTWDELFAARRAFDELMSTVSHTVHVIFNLNRTMLPVGDALYNFKAIGGQYPKHTGTLVVVNATGFGVKITQIVMRVFRIWANMVFMDNMEAAYNHIASQVTK